MAPPGARVGVVADLWRYPVKSMGGVRARSLFLGPFGIQGDRLHAVVSPGGALVTARRASRLLGFDAAYGDPEGTRDLVVTTPDGERLEPGDPALDTALSEFIGREVHLAQASAGVFDAAPLHIVCDASIAQLGEWSGLGHDIETRRFRPNVVVALDAPEPFAESEWVEAEIAFGHGPRVHVSSPTERCAVTTLDPDTLERDNRVLQALTGRLENLFGVYASVTRPGWLHVGDPVVVHAVG